MPEKPAQREMGSFLKGCKWFHFVRVGPRKWVRLVILPAGLGAFRTPRPRVTQRAPRGVPPGPDGGAAFAQQVVAALGMSDIEIAVTGEARLAASCSRETGCWGGGTRLSFRFEIYHRERLEPEMRLGQAMGKKGVLSWDGR